MPKDEEKTTVEGGEKDAAPVKKGSNKLILFGGIGFAVVAIGVALALFVLKPMMANSGGGDRADGTEQAKESHGDESGHDDGHGGAKRSLVYAVKDIVVNPAGTGGTRFLSVSFGFELGNARLATSFEEREPLVRDALITILSSKTVAQLTDAKQKEIVRYQIKKRLEKLLETDKINGVYYTDFVLQ